MELIYRDKLLKAIDDCDYCKECEHRSRRCSYTCDEDGRPEEAIINLIKNTPAVDAVEVVRCKECKHFSGAKDSNGYVTAVGYCNHINHYIMPCMFDFYCADGEKKEVQDAADL